MTSYTERVKKLRDNLPGDSSQTSVVGFNNILVEYRKILDELSDSSEDYIRNLWRFYSKLRTIESSMAVLYQLKIQKQKDTAFRDALKEISNDFEDLLKMVQR